MASTKDSPHCSWADSRSARRRDRLADDLAEVHRLKGGLPLPDVVEQVIHDAGCSPKFRVGIFQEGGEFLELRGHLQHGRAGPVPELRNEADRVLERISELMRQGQRQGALSRRAFHAAERVAGTVSARCKPRRYARRSCGSCNAGEVKCSSTCVRLGPEAPNAVRKLRRHREPGAADEGDDYPDILCTDDVTSNEIAYRPHHLLWTLKQEHMAAALDLAYFAAGQSVGKRHKAFC